MHDVFGFILPVLKVGNNGFGNGAVPENKKIPNNVKKFTVGPGMWSGSLYIRKI